MDDAVIHAPGCGRGSALDLVTYPSPRQYGKGTGRLARSSQPVLHVMLGAMEAVERHSRTNKPSAAACSRA